PSQDQLFHLTSRANAGVGQDLVQLAGLVVDARRAVPPGLAPAGSRQTDIARLRLGEDRYRDIVAGRIDGRVGPIALPSECRPILGRPTTNFAIGRRIPVAALGACIRRVPAPAGIAAASAPAPKAAARCAVAGALSGPGLGSLAVRGAAAL